MYQSCCSDAPVPGSNHACDLKCYKLSRTAQTARNGCYPSVLGWRNNLVVSVFAYALKQLCAAALIPHGFAQTRNRKLDLFGAGQ